MLLSTILLNCDYDFKDPNILINKPILNVDIDREPEILVHIRDKSTPANPTHSH